MGRNRKSCTVIMEDEQARRDPLDALGGDLLGIVLRNLTPRHLLKCGLVSKGWNEVSNRAPLWRAHCQDAWEGKRHNPAAAREDLTWKRRYLLADADRKRVGITYVELTSFAWKFR